MECFRGRMSQLLSQHLISRADNAGLTGVAAKSCWAERYVQVYLQDVRQREKGDEKEKCSANLYVLLHFCSNTIPPHNSFTLYLIHLIVHVITTSNWLLAHIMTECRNNEAAMYTCAARY